MVVLRVFIEISGLFFIELGTSHFSDVFHWKEKVSKVRSGEAEDKDYVCLRQNFVMALKEDYIFKWHAWACVPCVFLWLSIKPNRTTSAGLVGSRIASHLKKSQR